MKFSNAAAVEQVVWEMRLADYPRALNRTRINNLFNGVPPYSAEEQRQNRIKVNVNHLEATHIAMSARGQFSNALVSPDPLLNIEIDYGPAWERREMASRITKEINKKLKGSLDWQEEEESVFASVVLHGPGPAHWPDRHRAVPIARGIEDVLIPSETLRSLENLPFFAVYRSWTYPELYRMTHGPKVDPGWNLPVVEQALQWVDQEAMKLLGTRWPEIWSPEKMAERIKEDSGLYMSDAVPTIDTFDLYFWNDDARQAGWKRRMILDAWGNPGVGGAGGIATPGGRYGVTNKSEFLYDSGKRNYASKLGEIIHFQFGDASAVAPFRYHSIRSLGFLLYAVCHLQNRLKCKFHEHVFENLLQYFRSANPNDAERITKVDLIDKGIIPEGLSFVKQEERWQINDGVVQQALQMNRQTMADNSASFTQDMDFEEKAEETATRTMAKMNTANALVGSMLSRAYNYQKFKLNEVCRRFCIKNSRDPMVRSFRVEMLKAGIPEEALNVERWNVQPVRVIGNGNRLLQTAMMDKIMTSAYDKLDPEAQKEMLRLFVAVNTNDYDLANRSVPDGPKITDTVHDAQLAAGALMMGLPVAARPGLNQAEYVETLLHSMATVIKRIETTSAGGTGQGGGMADAKEITGLQNLGLHIQQHIQIIAQDKAEKPRVKKYADDLKNLMNLVKAYAQRLAEQQQQAQAQNGSDPKDKAKVQAMLMQAATKMKLATESHAQKTAQRQLQFQQEMRQR